MDSIVANQNLQPIPVRIVLTHCAICARELTDAASAEIGIGPVCRARAGYDELPEALRRRANVIIRRVALDLKNRDAIMVAGDELLMMGMEKLAACIVERFATVILSLTDDGRIAFKAPWSVGFWDAIRGLGETVRSRGRRVFAMDCTWGNAVALNQLLGQYFGGCAARGPEESFWIRGAA